MGKLCLTIPSSYCVTSAWGSIQQKGGDNETQSCEAVDYERKPGKVELGLEDLETQKGQ